MGIGTGVQMDHAPMLVHMDTRILWHVRSAPANIGAHDREHEHQKRDDGTEPHERQYTQVRHQIEGINGEVPCWQAMRASRATELAAEYPCSLRTWSANRVTAGSGE